MAEDALRELPQWDEFAKAAREHGRNPLRLLGDYMRDCLEIWQDQKLDDEIRADLSESPYGEDDAVEIVRQARREKAGIRDAA